LNIIKDIGIIYLYVPESHSPAEWTLVLFDMVILTVRSPASLKYPITMTQPRLNRCAPLFSNSPSAAMLDSIYIKASKLRTLTR
jgi:hypothetical protein